MRCYMQHTSNYAINVNLYYHLTIAFTSYSLVNCTPEVIIGFLLFLKLLASNCLPMIINSFMIGAFVISLYYLVPRTIAFYV